MQPIHHPPHLHLDDTWYFLTARVYQNQPLFNTDCKKQLLLNKIKEEFKKFDYHLIAWIILNNHYHIEFKTKWGNNLPGIINRVHGRISFELNKIDATPSRKVFQNYWDHCLRDEKSFWRHFNYIHYNCLKHNYANKMEDYPFSSYNAWLKKKGKKWLDSYFELPSYIDMEDD